MADLKTDYKDDVLDTTQNTKRKYQMIDNGDGTVSFEDVTEYLQQGDSFGATDINAITEAVNNNSGMPVGTIATFDGTTLPSGFEPYQTEEQRAIAQINDNLAQTPITVGGETLNTIDDKLNYLLEGKQTFDIIAFERLEASGTQNYSINSNYKYILHVINMYAQATYNNNCTLATIENGNITYYNHGTKYQTITLSNGTLTVHEGSGNAPLAISLIKLN